MSVLIVTGMIRGAASTMCSFTMSVNGGPFSQPDNVILAEVFFTIPDQPANVIVRAAALDSAKYGIMDGAFQVDSSGNLVGAGAPAEFAPPLTLTTFPIRTISLLVFFTPLFDVTERARLSLNRTGPDFPGHPPAPAPGDMSFRQSLTAMPPASLSPLRALNDVTFIASPSIASGKIRVQSRNSTPQGQVTIFEWPSVRAPKQYAVFWPTAVPTGPGAPRTPFLIYFHPTAGQNAPAFFVDPRDRHDPASGSTYPFGFDYQFFGFWRYFNYDGDPLKQDPFCKGLAYQVEGSAKNTVLVLPLNKVASNPCDEVEALKEAGFVQELLEELQAFAFRRGGNFQPPGIGHCGMAAFSSGHALLSCFLTNTANHAHPLFLDVLREMYLFDPHADQPAITLEPVLHVAFWASVGQSATKVARLYTQHDAVQLAPILLALGVPAGTVPFDAIAPSNPRRSVTSVPLAAWNALATSVGSTVPYNNTGQVHQVIPALMLTDALRRSDF